MSLPDGEYDIDLAQLLDLAAISPQNDHDNVAMRYGFIPDLMDQSKPLTLYQNEQECILQAKSNYGKPIIFEGIPQRHRGSVNNTSNDSYYLTYVPNKSKAIKLKRLNSTIRFSKSRNVSKLQTKMVEWEKEHEIEQRRGNRERTSRPEPPKKLPERQDPRISERVPEQKARLTVASKRAPSENTTPSMLERPEEAIISESDFDDLNDYDFEDKPIPFLDEAKGKKNKKILKIPQIVVEKPKKPRQKPKPIVEQVDDSIDMDDDFKDLEDQLQEVLEEDESAEATPEPGKAQNFGLLFDSDESDADDYGYSGLGITINVDEGTSQAEKNTYRYLEKAGKPTSLRDLVEDGSSSEEE